MSASDDISERCRYTFTLITQRILHLSEMNKDSLSLYIGMIDNCIRHVEIRTTGPVDPVLVFLNPIRTGGGGGIHPPPTVFALYKIV